MSTSVGSQSSAAKQLVLDRARLDVARPTNDHRSAVAAFPSLALLALERGNAAVREADRLGAVVGGEDDEGVVELAHVLQLLEHIADVVVHLLHAGFVDAPVLAARLAHHRLVLRWQHGRDVHARGVVPDEERLVGFLGVVAIEEVDDLGRDFLIHRFGSLQRQWALVTAGLGLLRAVERNCTRALAAAASGRSLSLDRRRQERRERRGSVCSCTAAQRSAPWGSC